MDQRQSASKKKQTQISAEKRRYKIITKLVRMDQRQSVYPVAIAIGAYKKKQTQKSIITKLVRMDQRQKKSRRR